MRKLIIFISSIGMIFIAILCTPPENITLKRYEKSDYIFSGELIKQSASTMPVYVKDQNASIVKVDKVLKASEGHENFEGREITVLLGREEQAKLERGFYGIFFTKTWLFGNSLAVLMNSVEPDTSKTSQVQAEIKQFQQEEDNKTLESRVKIADLIVYGKVEKIEDPEIKKQIFISEHDPMLKKAIIIKNEILKGNMQGDRITFYFASSTDVQWYQAPKFTPSKEGIFLLKMNADVQGQKEAYTLLNPLDFQESSKLEAIKKILK